MRLNLYILMDWVNDTGNPTRLIRNEILTNLYIDSPPSLDGGRSTCFSIVAFGIHCSERQHGVGNCTFSAAS
jgi:hypothetical protein